MLYNRYEISNSSGVFKNLIKVLILTNKENSLNTPRMVAPNNGTLIQNNSHTVLVSVRSKSIPNNGPPEVNNNHNVSNILCKTV